MTSALPDALMAPMVSKLEQIGCPIAAGFVMIITGALFWLFFKFARKHLDV